MFRRTLISAASLFAVVSFSTDANAWQWNTDARITQVINYYDAGGPADPIVFLLLDNGQYCHFDATSGPGKTMLSTAVAAFLSGRTVQVVCADEATRAIDPPAPDHLPNSRVIHRFRMY